MLVCCPFLNVYSIAIDALIASSIRIEVLQWNKHFDVASTYIS